MWIAKKGTGRSAQQKESGWVRAESAKHGEQYVVGSCEYRRLQRCAPYGIYTKPPKGTPVLVLGSQGGEVCLGAVSDPSAEEELLQEGEILIRSAGGASIRLCKDGRLLLNGMETGGIGMELLLQHGDHSRNGQGFLQEVDGAQQLVQRAMVRLTVPKGKFVLNPQLGSLLHTLGRTAPAQREQLALEYAQEALLEMPEVRVVAARCKQGTQADELLVKFELECTLADGQLARSVVEWRMNF